jgi:hypothetical protein
MTDFVKSTNGLVVCRRGFAVVMIMGNVRNCVIDSGFVMVGSRPAASSASSALELSVSTKKCCEVALGRLSKSACKAAALKPGESLTSSSNPS